MDSAGGMEAVVTQPTSEALSDEEFLAWAHKHWFVNYLPGTDSVLCLLTIADQALARCEAAEARVEELKRGYESKVEDFAKETLRVSKVLRACEEGNGFRHSGNKWCPVGDAGIGWNYALEWVEKQVIAAQPEPDTRRERLRRG